MLFILLLVLTLYIVHFYWKVSRYPKGPFPIPFFGNLFQLTPMQLHLDIERLRKIHGDVFTMWFFGSPSVVITREEAIKEALIANSEIFLNRPDEFIFTIFQSTENGGITFASGENWREQRNAAVAILRSFGMGKNVMEQQIHQQIELLTDAIKASENKDALDLSWPIQVYVANVINNLLYGYSYPHDKSERLMTYTAAINLIFKEMIGSVWVLLGQCLDFVKEDVKKALVSYSREEEPNCLSQAYFQKIGTNKFLNMENLYNVCADFFMAGMETTTTTLRWATLYLADHQDIQSKMRSEIAKVIGFGRLPSLKDRPSMPFTNAVIVELQRITNVVGFSLLRKTTTDTVINGIAIPAGANCIPQIYSCQVDERFFPEPEKFNPERFINDNGSLNTALTGHTMLFGLGKRQCAGESLAKAELFLGIASLIQSLYPSEGVPIDYSSIYGTFIVPKNTVLRIEEVNPENF